MKRTDKPSVEPAAVLDACINGIREQALKVLFTKAKPNLLAQFAIYESNARSGTLYSFNASMHGNPNQVVIAGLSKNELMKLYSNHMVQGGQLGREYYDSIIMLAPLGKCPYCGFGQVSTLDHFLPKARYPMFSVLTFNLVPSCTDCNKGKCSPVLSLDNQVLHPYFEEATIEKTPWLFCNVIESTPATVEYFVQPPATWSTTIKQRIVNHFTDFDLSRRFAIEAACAIAGLSYRLETLQTQQARREHLLACAKSERKIHTNSWQAALYDSLAASAWYQESGFRN